MLLSDPKCRRFAAPALVVLGLVLTWVGYRAARHHERERAREDLVSMAGLHASAIASRLSEMAGSVESVGDLLGLHPDLPSAEFQLVARRTFSRQPAVQALYWAPLSAASENAFSVRCQETADSSAEPLFPSRLDALGPTLAKARATGRLAFGGAVPVRQGESAVVVILPVKTPGPTVTATSPLIGYLVALCSPSVLATPPVGVPPGEWLLVDHSATDKALRRLASLNPSADAPPIDADPDWHCENLIAAGDRTWLLFFRPTPATLDAMSGTVSRWVFATGLAASLLLAILAHEALSRRGAIEREAARRSRELQEKAEKLEADIRRHQQAEASLRSSEQTLYSLMENSPGAIYVKDVEGRYVAVNRRFLELHGRTRESFIGHSDFELFPPDLAARVRKSDAQVMTGAEPIEVEESFQLIDGTRVNLVHKFPLIDVDGSVHGVCAIASDITERKRAEAEVRESRRQLESLLGQLPGLAFRYENDSKLTPVYISRGAAGLTGYSAKEFLERHVSLEEIIHPEDRQRVRSAIASAVKKRRAFEIEYRLLDRSGREKWVLERGQGYYDENGALLFVEGLAIDITQRKDAESEKLLVERRLLEGQKLESIGVLAGGIAHDFNNLLTGVIGNANLASLDLPPSSPIRNNLKQIEIASQRAAELCQQMLAYAGKGRFVVQQLEIGQLVISTVPLLQASISKRAKLRYDLQPNLPAVMSDSTQIRQIIMNLVINASESLGEKDGEIVITTNLVRPAADWFENAVLAPPDINRDFIRLEVRDTGCGMTAETISKIFEPFYTTKFTGRGLGLAAVLGIIRSHQGGLIVRSVVGKGSIFALFFPAASSVRVAAAPVPSQPTNLPWRSTGRILVVDDEAHVLKVTAGMLATWGLSVQTANDGYEALDCFRADPNGYVLVLLDMTMPRLSGEETLALLREIKPEVRVLFMSGYNRREVVDALPGRSTLGFVQKPFTLKSLRENLQQMLG